MNDSPMYARYILKPLSTELCRNKWGLTSDVFLLWSSFFRAGGLLDIDHQLLLSLVLVHWTSWVMDFVIEPDNERKTALLA